MKKKFKFLLLTCLLVTVGFFESAVAAVQDHFSQTMTDQEILNKKESQRDQEMVSDLSRIRKRDLSMVNGGKLSVLQTSLVSEIELYSDVIEAYELGEKARFETRANELLMRFPNGIYADDSMHLMGMMAISDKDFGRALSYFNQVVRIHGKSNRAPTSGFAKGVVYRKMQLSQLAKKSFKEVIARYPGSTESFRAQAELQMIR